MAWPKTSLSPFSAACHALFPIPPTLPALYFKGMTQEHDHLPTQIRPQEQASRPSVFSDDQNSSRGNTRSCYLPPQHGSCKGCASRLLQQAGSAEKRVCALNCFSHEKAARPEVMLFTPVIRLQKQLLKSTGHKLLIGQGRVAQ